MPPFRVAIYTEAVLRQFGARVCRRRSNGPPLIETLTANFQGTLRFDIVSGSWRFRAWRQDNSVAAAIGAQIVYSLTTHKYLRIRETGSTIYLDTSPDAST